MAFTVVPTPDDPWTMTLDDPAAATPAATTPKQGITDPAIPSTTPGASQTPAASSGPSNSPSGDVGTPSGGLTSADPATRIDALYKQYGLSDAGRGSGFADRAYWLEHPSEILNGRLANDLAGTGSDQPTGTPGRGPWLNSGRNAPEASIGQATRDANGGFWDYALSTLGNPNVNNPSTMFAPGGTSPSSPAPAGWHWDPNVARYVPDQPGADSSLSGSATTSGASTPGGSATPVQTPLPSSVQGGVPTSGNPNPTGGVAPTDDAYRSAILNALTGGGAGGSEPTDPFGAKP